MIGIVLVSHVETIASGIKQLLEAFNSEVDINYAKTNGEIGTTFEAVSQAVSENKATDLLVFYDLGSSKLNAQLVLSLNEQKKLEILDCALVEGSFVALNLIANQLSFEEIVTALRAEELPSKKDL